MNLNRFWRWILRIWSWVAEGKVGLMCVLVIVAVILWGFVVCRSEKSIRLVGYALQFFGMWLAIRGLIRIRVHFGQHSLRHLFVNWLKRFPKWTPSVLEFRGAVDLPLSGGKGRVEGWVQDNPLEPIEKRIEGILENMERVKEELRVHADSIENLRDSHEDHKKRLAEDSKNMEETIRSDLESLHTSDLIPSLVGLIWLLVGITMSTIPKELLKIVNGLFV